MTEFNITLLETPRRDLSRRERKALRASNQKGVTMEEADRLVRMGGAVEVKETIGLAELQYAYTALREFLEHPFSGEGDNRGYITMPITMRRHMAVGYAAIGAFLSDGKLKVAK